jgi:hypothetical protein
MATGDQADFQARLRALLPAVWFGDSYPVLMLVLAGIANALAAIYLLIAFTRAQTRLATAQGGFVDLWANDYLGASIIRLPQETDTAFKARTQWTITAPRGTKPGLKEMLEFLTGNAPRVIEPANSGDTGGWAGPLGTEGAGLFAWDDGSGTVGAGAWGSLLLPYQLFITVYRPALQASASLGGWTGPLGTEGDALGGWSGAAPYTSDSGSLAFTDDNMVAATLTGAFLIAAVYEWMPAGSIAWVNLSN